MDFRKWQEEGQKHKSSNDASLPIEEKFFGRKDELSQLKTFIENNKQRIFCLYGVPMIGKSTLIREFCKSITDYETINIKFNNPENPDISLEKNLSRIDFTGQKKQLIVLENFEEVLLWKGDHEHLHEVKFLKVKQFLLGISKYQNNKIIIESRFQIKNDFIAGNFINELLSKQLGKIERKELFNALNKIYRHNRVQYDAFDDVCEELNDHVWLIELAMQADWLFEDIREAAQNPKSITQQLWDKIQIIIRKLSTNERVLLCAFGILNPISENDLKENLENSVFFQKKDILANSLFSLRKKLLLVYETKTKSYGLNPFLREVCFTYLYGQKEMITLKEIPFFKNIQLPKYNNILQAQEKGDYGTFYRLIHDLRRKKSYDTVHELLNHVLENDNVINKRGVLNEIGITYKWQKNYPKAIETLEKALKINDKDVKTLNEIAIVYKEQRNYIESIKYLEKALTTEPKNVKVLNELGIVYKEQKNYSKAIEYLEKACQLGNIPSYTELAIVYKEQKNYSKAIEYLEKACQLGNVPSYTVLGIVYKEQKNYSKSIKTLEKSLMISDKDVKTLAELAIVYKEYGELEKAKNVAIKGLSIEPHNQFLKSILNTTNKAQAGTNDKVIIQTMANVKQKILFIAANPSNESRLQTDVEYKIIKAEIKREHIVIPLNFSNHNLLLRLQN